MKQEIGEKMYSYTPISLRRRECREKEKEKNLLSAVLSMVVIALLSTAIAQPRWFKLKGGGCSKSSLGVNEFLYVGYFDTNSDDVTASADGEMASVNGGTSQMPVVYHSYDDKFVNCVTPTIVSLLRLVIAFLFLGIATSSFAFFMDTWGVSHRILKTLRRNAVGTIFTVLFCVTIIGICYFLSTLISHQQELTRMNKGAKVEVKFDVSFFLLTAAGSVAVLATAANVLRRYPSSDDLQDDDALLDEFDGMETFSVNCINNGDVPPLRYLPPPPPYSP